MERSLKVTQAWFADNWRLILVILAGISAVSTMLLFKLGSLVHGLSDSEFSLQQSIAHNSLSLEHLIRDPINLPYNLGLYVMQFSPFHGPSTVRLTGAVFGLLGAIGFFYILRKWYTLRMAMLGTALFATSSWFLHSARFASPEASYLLLPLLIAGVIYIQAKARKHLVLFLITVLGLLCLYIPGMIWFLVAAIFLQRHVIFRSLRLQPLWFQLTIAVTAIVLLIPLVTMVVWPLGENTRNILSIMGLPTHIPSLVDILKNIAHILGNIFVYNIQGPLYVPGHLPLLSAGTSALALIGLFQFIVHFRLARTQLIVLVGLLGTVLISFGGPVALVLLLPFLYLLVIEGLKWLLERWLQVFPRNPLARGFGVVIVVVFVCVTSFYHLNRYFLAWGHSPETRAVFNKVP
jgi:hypothetical protein